MEIFFLIMAVIICNLTLLSLSGVFGQSDKETNYNARQKNTTKIINNQKVIKNLAIANTLLLTILIAIIIFVIIKIYPYLDTLKEYYEMLDKLLRTPVSELMH